MPTINSNSLIHPNEIKSETIKIDFDKVPGGNGRIPQLLQLRKNLKVSFLINNSKYQSFIPQQINFLEIMEIAELEALCYPKKERYDFETLCYFLSQKGMASIRISDEITSQLIAFHLFQTKTGELITLDVHPDFRKMGYGTSLVNQSLDYLKKLNHTQVKCEIAVENEKSLRLHYRLGFKAVKTLKNYYGKYKDAYLLSASL